MARWSIPIAAAAARMGGDLQKAAQKTTFDLFDSVQRLSPVLTGQFVGNWQFTAGAAAVGIVPILDPSHTHAHAEAGKALVTPAGGQVFFTNNLPYGYRLEYEGWSKKAPQGFVRISLLNLKLAA